MRLLHENTVLYIKLLAINVMTAILIYLTLISQQLTNHFDALWIGPFYIANSWEISIGRWLWPVLDWLRMGYAADPYNSYLAIFFFSLGNLLITDIFSMCKGGKRIYAINAIIFSSTTVSAFLSYRFMSPTFGLSYLLSISAIWCIIKKNSWINWLLASALICLSLGLYQANLGCACLLATAFILRFCLDENDNKKILECIFKVGSSIAAACVVYKIIWDFVLRISQLTASTYNVAANVSIIYMIKRLPGQVVTAYSKFYAYFFKNEFKHSIFQTTYIYNIIFLFLLILLFWQSYTLLQKREWIRLIVYFLGIILLPVACNISVLLAPEAGFMIQQTCAMAILIPVVLCILDKKIQDIKSNFWLKRAGTGIILLVLYGNIYMTAIDLEAMYEGKNASENIMDYVVQSLIDKELYSADKQYFFVGRISNSPLFRVSQLWGDANSYARYGEFWTDASAIGKLYDGVLLDMGITLPIGPGDIYQEYINSGLIEDMPVYPADGSIINVGDHVVVKMSNVY